MTHPCPGSVRAVARTTPRPGYRPAVRGMDVHRARPPTDGEPMTQLSTGGATRAAPAAEPSTGQLVSELTDQISRLVRDEARLPPAEGTQKPKKRGVGAGLFGGAGLFAFFGLA